MVAVTALIGDATSRTGDVLLCEVFRCLGAVEDEKLAVWKVCEGRNREVQLLSPDVGGGALEHLRDQEGLIFGKVAIVEDQEELGSILETLDIMRDSGWEEPDI
jgi:hypothetical protein